MSGYPRRIVSRMKIFSMLLSRSWQRPRFRGRHPRWQLIRLAKLIPTSPVVQHSLLGDVMLFDEVLNAAAPRAAALPPWAATSSVGGLFLGGRSPPEPGLAMVLATRCTYFGMTGGGFARGPWPGWT